VALVCCSAFFTILQSFEIYERYFLSNELIILLTYGTVSILRVMIRKVRIRIRHSVMVTFC